MRGSDRNGDPEERRDRRPPRGLASRGGRRRGPRYSIFVGLAFAGIIAVAVINGLQTDEGSVLGPGDDRGWPLPEFAVPDALGSLEGDANIAQDDCESSEVPCPADRRRTPACEVKGEGVIRVCDLFERPLAISFWFTRGGDCLPTQDDFDRVARSFRGRVNFLSINVRDDRDRVRELVRERGWTVPVGHDADGAVSNIYRVGGCPTVAFAFPGGILMDAAVGSEQLSAPRIEATVKRLLRSSRRRAAIAR